MTVEDAPASASRVAIVTGGSGAIGRAVAEKLATHCMSVAVHLNRTEEFTPMSSSPVDAASGGLATGIWTLDPARSSLEFHVRHFYGLMTVKGGFDRYRGTLDLSARPVVDLVIEADSLDTGNKQRDKHLRSDDFFDVANHPQVRFEADAATLDGDTLTARGLLYAAGKHIPLDIAVTITPVDDGFEIEATALADHRQLGMTWSPLGILRAPSKLIVRGRLVRAENVL